MVLVGDALELMGKTRAGTFDDSGLVGARDKAQSLDYVARAEVGVIRTWCETGSIQRFLAGAEQKIA